MKRLLLAPLVFVFLACRGSAPAPTTVASVGATADSASHASPATLPLVLVSDVPLPGKAARFDYQDLDLAKGHLVIAHMDDDSVVVLNSRDGSLVKVLPGIRTPRGVVVAGDVGRIFVTSMPNQLVIIDNASLTEIARVGTGQAPDGVGWDPVHRTVGVSDQRDGAISLIGDSGSGNRKQLALGAETGNVVFDSTRAVFWITVVAKTPPNQLVAVDPLTARQTTSIALTGCTGAHGLRIHPDGKSALVACEGNSKVARVELEHAHAINLAPSGDDPDVLAIDPELGWLYVAAESGDLKVFDLRKPGLVSIDSEHPGDASHSVAVDPRTHRLFFPLVSGNSGSPVLRIMKPRGT